MMMYFTETIDGLDRMANQIMIIFGIVMCILGLIGNFLNIHVFITWSRFRQKSLKSFQKSNIPLYLLASSFANLFVITYPLLTRIMFDGYKYRVTRANVFLLCKFRYYVLHTFDLVSLTCICMAIFDRYLISSRNVYVRDLSSTKKRTILIIFVLIVILSVHSIPLIIFYDVSKTGHCQIFSPKYSYYYLYVFQISLRGLIPITFLTIFGVLTLKSLSANTRCHHLNSDRQLSRMLLLISIAIIFSTIPNCIEEIYDLIFASEDRGHSSKFFLYHVVSSILFYTIPVTSFYIYFISTPNFRAQLRHLCQPNRSNDYWNQCHTPTRRMTLV